MSNLILNHMGIPFPQITIQDALNRIKLDIENAIIQGGTIRKNALIRTQAPITLIHNAIKTELLQQNIHPSLINPNIDWLLRLINPKSKFRDVPVRLKDREQNLAGYFMKKNQDICVIPKNININPEILVMPTGLQGELDNYGTTFTESILSVNVRSQLSSTNKNKHTLYERTIAEALNLHQRLPNIVLAEVYMIIVKEYDDSLSNINEIGFRHAGNIARYIKDFQAINSRANAADVYFKYERCCLLIVDFSQTIPKIYNTVDELINDGLLDANTTVSLDGLNYSTFITDVLNIYSNRFPQNEFN